MKARIFLFIISLSLFATPAKAQQVTAQYINAGDSLKSAFLNAVEVDSLLYIEDVCPEIDTTGRKPLFLIHGWSFSGVPAPPGGGYWNFFRDYLKADPELSANFKPYYVRYWSNHVPVSDIAAELRRKVEEAGFHKKKITIAAHSMGGLVSRSYMEEQRFTKGPEAGEKCGVLVDQLITLGTPHHGSPMANYNARNEFYKGTSSLMIYILEELAFSDVPYNRVNRSDLRWDNYNGLMDYLEYPGEANDWLLQLNNNSLFNTRIICYSGAINGSSTIPIGGDLGDQYAYLAYMQKKGFSYENDGIVPLASAELDGLEVKHIRHFEGYDHADLNRGKEGQREILFDFFKIDLNRVKPLRVTQPGLKKLYLKSGSEYEVVWYAPPTVDSVNVYFSSDNGASFSKIAENINAGTGSYNWTVPDLLADNCLIKVTDAGFEYEYSQSATSFTVYENRVEFESPVAGNYFVNYRDDTIRWSYQGLMCNATVRYIDEKNDTSIVLADSLEMQHGNSYAIAWPANTSIAETDMGQISVQLTGLEERYGDTTTYRFKSEYFMNFDEPVLELLSPESNPKGVDGISGMPYVANETYLVNYNVGGEIKYIELLLCDSSKTCIDTLLTTSVDPGIFKQQNINVTMPEVQGDAFYFYMKAGVSADSILVDDYSDNTFRVNYKPQIIEPYGGQLDVKLLPCFEMETVNGASEYVFRYHPAEGPESWAKGYSSEDARVCVPNRIDEELTPGMRYHLSARAMVNGLWTYTDTVLFTAEASQPYDFAITTPQNGDSLETETITVEWNRAVGADNYKVELVQGVSVFESALLENTDTTYELGISDLLFYENADVIVYAINAYGQTTNISTIIRKYKTGVEAFTENNVAELKVYPNPVNDQTVIEFKAFANIHEAELNLFDMAGKKVASLKTESQYNGIYRVRWQHLSENRTLQPGTYVLQLRTLQGVEREKVNIILN